MVSFFVRSAASSSAPGWLMRLCTCLVPVLIIWSPGRQLHMVDGVRRSSPSHSGSGQLRSSTSGHLPAFPGLDQSFGSFRPPSGSHHPATDLNNTQMPPSTLYHAYIEAEFDVPLLGESPSVSLELAPYSSTLQNYLDPSPSEGERTETHQTLRLRLELRAHPLIGLSSEEMSKSVKEADSYKSYLMMEMLPQGGRSYLNPSPGSSIYFEPQGPASWDCAKHAANMLWQGPLFTSDDFTVAASQLGANAVAELGEEEAKEHAPFIGTGAGKNSNHFVGTQRSRTFHNCWCGSGARWAEVL